MKKLLIAIASLLLFASCSNGKIDYLDTSICKNGQFEAQGAYLVNTSRSQRLQFTIKSYPHKEANVITTTTYVLEPGAQTFLGCLTFEHDYRYEIVGEREVK